MHPTRSTRRAQLTNSSYWTKSNAELTYIRKDAYEASLAMRDHDATAEAKYLEQVADAETVLANRRNRSK